MPKKSPDRHSQQIPVIDLFAGPGGLGEGFSAFEDRGKSPFVVRLSIEKDPTACATLRLRKYFREFRDPPEIFPKYYAGRLAADELYSAYPKEADRALRATWQAELGKVDQRQVALQVRTALDGARDWVLLGGPPCQAYSIVGRARMRTTRPDFEQDERHFLYREYLRIVADHRPAVFVLENVKGLLTSKHGGSKIISRILDDLAAPRRALDLSAGESLNYRLYPLGAQQSEFPWMEGARMDGAEFLLQAEDYGIPQQRHRIFIVGIRSDIAGRPEPLQPRPHISVRDVISDMPPIRSTLSRGNETPVAWREAVKSIGVQKWMSAPQTADQVRVAREVRAALKQITSAKLEPGKAYVQHRRLPSFHSEWYRSNAVGLTLHESRAHMESDLHRYLFCASFTKVHGRSPKLRDFPKELYPSHENISEAIKGDMFDDRFRVQRADQPAATITSHISKDGHYYIHYDPAQCRSLSVREAARLQTFPDSYFFEGTRTAKYHQVGNAVPPLLAQEIAKEIFSLLAGRGSN